MNFFNYNYIFYPKIIVTPCSPSLCSFSTSNVIKSEDNRYKNLTIKTSGISLWFERWFLSSNAKDIGVLYLIYALFSGLVGTAFSVLIRLELSGPGVQYIADNQLYNSIITAHAIIMIFFMVKKYLILNSHFSFFPSPQACGEGKEVNNDNNYSPYLSKCDNNDDNNPYNYQNNHQNGDNKKHPYVKVLVDDPYNNRDIILNVTKKQNGVSYSTPNNLIPYWVTGFSDAESCFGFRVRKNPKLKAGWEVIPYFFINLHIKDLSVLSEIKDFFGVGNISSNKESALYQVNSLKDLVNVIIPHFELYPLLTKKKADFLLFKLAIELIKQKEHKNIEGIHKLIGIKASLNKGLLNDELNSSFKNVVSQERTEVALPEVINPYWFAGFTDFFFFCFKSTTNHEQKKTKKLGDGSFSVEILKSSSHKIGHQVILKFLITQHNGDLELLKCFNKFLGEGFIKERTDISEFRVIKLPLITDKLIPLFQKHPIIGNKNKDFLDFCQIAELMNSNAHKTPEGLDKIRVIKAGMNTKRKEFFY